MNIRTFKDVDLLYALFLGRAPENNFVREDNIGRPAFDLVSAMIISSEFQQEIMEQFTLHRQLPHRDLSASLLPDVLELVTDAGLAPPCSGVVAGNWNAVLARVLAALPCRQMIELKYGKAGSQFIARLGSAEQPGEPDRGEQVSSLPLPSMVSGVEIIANTICRGWIVDRDHPTAIIHLVLKINGSIHKIFIADEFRRDVKELYGGEGRAGFRIRLDLIPEAAYLNRATLEIREVAQNTVVLPEQIVEFRSFPAIRMEAEIREVLAEVRNYLTSVSALSSTDDGRMALFRKTASYIWSGRSDENVILLRDELVQFRRSLERLEQAMPRLENSQSWALPFYGPLRPFFDPVLRPPASDGSIKFSMIILADDGEEAAARETVSSLLSQSRSPADIHVLLAPGSPPFVVPPSGQSIVEVSRLKPAQLPAAAVNEVVAELTGSHLVVVEAGVILAPDALAWLEVAIERTNAVICYTDGEVADSGPDEERRLAPLFRPAFDYDLLLQRNYIGTTFCIERQAYLEIGGLSRDETVEVFHDLLLRTFERCGRGAFVHLPLVLVCGPERGEAGSAGGRTIGTVRNHLDRIGGGALAAAHEDGFGRSVPNAVKVLWPDNPETPISVIVPTHSSVDMVFALVSSLYRHASLWERVEVIVIVNGERDERSRFGFSEIEKVFPGVDITYRPVAFNWPEINNTAAAAVSSEGILLFLNDDMVCLTEGWDMRLRGQLARPEVGVLGARLLYPNGCIQHAGIAFGAEGTTCHEAMGDNADDGLYLDRTLLVHEVGAVTGAFLACRRATFEAVGRFDAQHFPITVNDTDFCVRIRAAGKAVIYDPFLTWIHYEAASRGLDSLDREKLRRSQAEHDVLRSLHSEADLVDLSGNPHLLGRGRPFEVFHRPERRMIELWLKAQLNRRDAENDRGRLQLPSLGA